MMDNGRKLNELKRNYKMNHEQQIQASLEAMFETAKERSINAIFNDGTKIDYAFVTGWYESAFSNMLKDMNLTKEQMDLLIRRCEMK